MPDTCQILIPPSVLQFNSDTGNGIELIDWSFERVAQWVVDNHPSFNRTGPGIRQGATILAAIQGCNPLDLRQIKRTDCQALLNALNEPAAGYLPPFTHRDASGSVLPVSVPARRFLPYLDAVEAALAGNPKLAESAAREQAPNGAATAVA